MRRTDSSSSDAIESGSLPQSLLEENRQLREQLQAVQLSMERLGQTMQLAHRDLTESCSALCREPPTLPSDGSDTTRAHWTSARRLALYLVRLTPPKLLGLPVKGIG